jgi:hypothetical protein
MNIRYFIFFCFFIFVSDIFGQAYIYRIDPSLFLDEFGNAHTAISFRKLRDGYSGRCVEVLKDSTGDLTSNIGFAGNFLDTVALKRFCGSNSCRIRTWYDQTGNGRNFVQETKANMPTIVNAGTIVRNEGYVIADFDGTNDLMSVNNSTAIYNFMHNGSFSTFLLVAHKNVVKGQIFFGTNRVTGSDIGFVLWESNSIPNNLGSVVVNPFLFPVGNYSNDNPLINSEHFLIFGFTDADNSIPENRSENYINNGVAIKNNAGTALPTTNNASNNLGIGSVGTSANFLNGGIKELIIYNSDKRGDRTGMQTNINTFYSIY